MQKNHVEYNNRAMVKGLDTQKYGLLSAIATMGILLLILASCKMLGGEYIFLKGDLYEQCAPFTHLFFEKIKEGSNLFYSFKAGLGMNTALLFSFEVFSPFNILYLFSNSDNVNAIAIIIFVLKAGLAAYSFQMYSRYNLRVDGIISALFAVGYSLVSYGIVVSDMPSLYDGIYLLPFILIAIKNLCIKKKVAWLIVLYAILFVSNFYSGYIVGLASFAYFLIFIANDKSMIENRCSIFIRYFFGVICAFLISAFIIAPTLYEAVNQSVVQDSYEFQSVSIWNIISYLFPFHDCVFFNMTPYYYCGLPATLLFGSYFVNSKIRVRNKIIAAITLVVSILSMMVMQLYAAAHMFNDPTGYTFRYVYIIAFVICSMGLISFRHIEGLDIKKALIIDLVLIVMHCVSPLANERFALYDNSPSAGYYIVTLLLVSIWIYLFFLIKKKNNNDKMIEFQGRIIAVVALLLMGIELGLNTYVLITTQGRSDRAAYNYTNNQAKMFATTLEQMDGSIYRVHYDGLVNENQASLFDYYGSTFYSTTSNQKLKEFLYSIGVSCTEFYILGNGSTDLSRLLLNEKYDLIAYLNYDISNENYIVENMTSGLGFMVDDSAMHYTAGDNVFDNQNAVYTSLYGETISPFDIYEGGVLLDSVDVNVEVGEYGDISISLLQETESGYCIVKVPLEADIDLYSWMFAGYNEVYPGSPIIYAPNGNVICDSINHMLTTPHIIKMSRDTDAYVLDVGFVPGTVKDISIIDYCFAYYDDAYIQRVKERLDEQSFMVEEFEDGHVVGNITCSKAGVCYIAIPYEEGWSALVDGNETVITPLFGDAFIGVPLEKGEHKIELVFEAPYSRLGILLSAIGIIILMIIIVLDRLQSKTDKNVE